MLDFKPIIAATILEEGGLVDNPADPGGLTNYGIALNEHPELTAEEIRALTPGQAAAIYQDKYVGALYPSLENATIARLLFDFGVTSGPAAAVRVLQNSLRACVAGPIIPDGVFGNLTLAAVNAADPRRLIREFVIQRIEFYVKIEKLDFDHSWFGRVIDALL